MTINRGTAGGGGETTIGDNNLFMAYVHVAHDCHIGNDTIFGRTPRSAATSASRTSPTSAPDRRASVLPRRPACVHRRLLGGDQGRAAVRADDRQPSGADLRRQHDRPERRGFTPDTITQLKQRLPVSAAVEAEHDARAGADRAGRVADRPGGPLSGRLHPHVAARRHPAPRHAPCRGARRRRRMKLTLGLIAGNGRFPFLVLDARARAGPRRHGHRDQGRDLHRAERRGRASRRGDPLDLARPAWHLHQPAEEGRRHAAVMAGQVKHTKIFGGVVPD